MSVYASLAEIKTGAPEIFPVATAAIAGSVIAHGLTDTIGAYPMGRLRAARK